MRKYAAYVVCFLAGTILATAANVALAAKEHRLTAAPDMAKINLSISDKPAPNVACSADGKTVFIVTRGGVFRSTNSGDDWTRIVDDQ